MSSVNWTRDAACKAAIARGEAKPEWWFPENSFKATEVLSRRARAICMSCPVREPCAKEGKRESGIWGGMNSRQREELEVEGRRCKRCTAPIDRAFYCEVCTKIVLLERRVS